MTSADVEAIAAACDAASHDERLADGMLYRKAAAMLRSLDARLKAYELRERIRNRNEAPL